MGNFDVDGYLERLGLDAEPPSVAALRRLHAAQVERVPYEALEIQLGRPTPLEPSASLARILRGRGGYCYHLNGAFSACCASSVTRSRATSAGCRAVRATCRTSTATTWR